MSNTGPDPRLLHDADWPLVFALLVWIRQRDLLPGWVVSMIEFMVSMFAPTAARNAKTIQDRADLQALWTAYESTHVPAKAQQRPDTASNRPDARE